MTYSGVLDLVVGGLLLTAVLVVWQRQLPSMILALTAQGVFLAAIPLAEGVHTGRAGEIGVAVLVLALRTVALPWLLFRALGPRSQRGTSTPLLNTTSSLLVAAVLILVAYGISRPIVTLDDSESVQAVPAALAVVLLGLFVIVVRRRAVSQAVGFLMLDNGMAACAFLVTAGVPFIVELGVSLDVLFALAVLRVLTGHLQREFGTADLDQLQELRD